MMLSEKISVIQRKGFKVYPVHNSNRKFAVCLEDESKLLYKKGKAKGDYKHTSKTINDAIIKMIEHIFNNVNNN